MISSHLRKFDLSNQNRGVFNSGQETDGDTTLEFSFIGNPLYMDVSENSGIPKSSILIGFSIIKIINHPFWDVPLFFGNIHIGSSKLLNMLLFSEELVQLGNPWNLFRFEVCQADFEVSWAWRLFLSVLARGSVCLLFFGNMKWKLMLPTLLFLFEFPCSPYRSPNFIRDANIFFPEGGSRRIVAVLF